MSRHEADPQIVLVRHGETEWSRLGKHTGTTDVDLTDAGEAEARRIGRALAGRSFALVLSSPRARALHTAQGAGMTGVRTDPNLAEWDYGELEGRTTPEIAAELGEGWTVWGEPLPGQPRPAETAAQVGDRADAVLERIAPVLASGHDVALFAHAHLLRILAARWLRLPATEGARLALDSGSISELGFEHGKNVVLRWNLAP